MIAMKDQVFKLAGVVFTCAVISACSSDVSNPPPLNSGAASAGDADFSKFVSIGDSLTAGYADGALYFAGQLNSFPSMLATQFADVGGGAFAQPLVADPTDPATVPGGNLGGLVLGGNPVLHPVTMINLFDNRFVLNTETQSPERLEGAGTIEITDLQTGAFNNVGVPGAKSFHLLAPAYGDVAGIAVATANPYFVRFASSITTTVIADAAAQAPSFVTLWIGNNDVLGFATSGGDGSDAITPTATFDGAYDGIVATLTGANADVQGVLINIPDVSTIPFFTTVPHNPVPLDQATADTLNAAFAAYNGGLAAAQGLTLITADEVAQRTINFVEGQNAVVILDEDLTDITGVNPALVNMRHATASDLVVLPAGGFIGTEDENSAGVTPPAGKPWGLGTPLGDEDVLIPSEIAAISTAQTAFNTKIKAVADANPNFVFLDAAAIMAELSTTGIDYGTGSINADFATGGAFSLDGVHPTARGYAVIANLIVDAINTGFNANVHKVDPATFPAVFLK